MPFHSMGFTIVLSSYLFWPLPHLSPSLIPPPPPPIPTSPPCHIQYDTVTEAEFWTLFSKTRPEAILPCHSMGFVMVLLSSLFWPLCPSPTSPLPTSPPCNIQFATVVEAAFWTLSSKTRPVLIPLDKERPYDLIY